MTKRTLTVWIQGSCFAGSIRAMLAQYPEINFKPAPNIMSADMILYTGGADISPQLYGEQCLQGTYVDQGQDKSDLDCWMVARKHDRFQVGICRGAQFLNAMNGGVLWQDVDHHAGNNHLVLDKLSGKTFEVSSLHHQACILNSNGELLASCEESARKISSKGGWTVSSGKPSVDVEAFWYKNTRSLGVQWHPECGPQDCINLFFDYIERYKDVQQEKERAVG